MSIFHGRQATSAMREHRIKKREEAEERNEHTLPENRRAVREPLSERPKRK